MLRPFWPSCSSTSSTFKLKIANFELTYFGPESDPRYFYFCLHIGKILFHFTHRSITESGRLKVDTFPPVPSGTTRMFGVGIKEIIECFRVVEIVVVVV